MLVVPFGRRELLGVVVGLSDASAVASERLLAPRRAVEADVPADLVELAGWIALEYCSTPARALSLVLPPGAGSGVHSLARLVAELTAAGRAAPASGVRLTAVQRAVLERLAPAGATPAVATGAAHGTLRRLEARGLVRLSHRSLARAPEHVAVGARRTGPLTLGGDQRVALQSLSEAIEARRFEALLLHGVTGSGKTEVYLRAAEADAGTGTRRDRARAGDRADPSDRRAFRRALRRHRRGRPLAPGRRRALRRVDAATPRAGAHLRRPTLGRVRADRGHRADRRRRGARLLLQARGRPALRRPPRRRAARAPGRGRAARRQRDAAPGELRPAPAAAAAGARRRQRAAGCRGARHARRPRGAARARPPPRSASCAAAAARRSCC
jgi:hypothetical protein